MARRFTIDQTFFEREKDQLILVRAALDTKEKYEVKLRMEQMG